MPRLLEIGYFCIKKLNIKGVKCAMTNWIQTEAAGKSKYSNTFLVESDFILIPKNSNIDVRKICYILESKTAYQARGSQRGRDASNEYSASKAVQKFCITYAGTHFQTTQDILTRMVQVLVRAGLRGLVDKYCDIPTT